MNGNKYAQQQQVVSDYERQRLEKLRQNAKMMEARGHGKNSLAKRIFDANAQIHFRYAREEDLYSDEDEEYTPKREEVEQEEEGGDCEPHDIHTTKVTRDTSQPKRPRTMYAATSKFVKESTQKDPVKDVRPATRSGSIGGCVKQVAQNQEMQLFMPKRVHDLNKQLQQEAFEKRNGVESQKKQPKKFCAPGSLSDFLELRKKQLGKRFNKEVENCCSNGEGLEGHMVLHNANGVMENDTQQMNIDNATIAVEVQGPPTSESSKEVCELKKHRGPTKLLHVHACTKEERQIIVLNSFGQPVGPTDKIVKEFKLFLGTIAMNSKLAPLNYCDWPSVPTYDDIWEYILERYIVPDEGRKCILETIGERWRGYKCWVKKRHYYAYDTHEERWEKRPTTISDAPFTDLLNYWSCEKVEETSQKNKGIRQLADDLHTLGPTSYALVRHQMKQEHPNKEEPSQAQVYIKSRTRNPKRKYKTSYCQIKENMEKMEALSAQQGEDGSSNHDPYYDVITKPEHHGRLRLYGKGATKTALKKAGNDGSKFVLPQEFLEGVEKDWVEKLQELNPGMNIVLPPSFGVHVSRNATTAKSSADGPSSVGMNSSNQGNDQAKGSKEHGLCNENHDDMEE